VPTLVLAKSGFVIVEGKSSLTLDDGGESNPELT